MKYDKTSDTTNRMMIVIVVTVASLLVAVTATHAFAATNYNSSKSNVYRQSTHQVSTGTGGEQVSTSTITINDNTVINQQGSSDQSTSQSGQSTSQSTDK
jgi:hypothetical protein